MSDSEPQADPPADLPADPPADPLARIAAQASRRGPPPVHLWHPAHCGTIDIRIRADGTWWHEGRPIAREGLVRLFASILRRDPEGFVLVTPAEKMSIAVEDAPFVAVDVERTPEGLLFTTSLGDEALAGPDRPLRVEQGPEGEPRPYVLVRGGLEARIDRKTFYRLADMAEERGEVWGVASGGAFFPLGPLA